ncbi:MAG: PASTA domain-containing protein [Spirochaetales bacterium]|nr:PASTA domain-containing protein [Spirochaetales bacterium]
MAKQLTYFKNGLAAVKNRVLIRSSDCDEKKAVKIIWYSFFLSLLILIVCSYSIFVGITFSGESVKVANVEGDNIYTAMRKLSEKDLSVRVFPKYSDEYAEGVVFNQSPEAGTLVKKNRNVSFNVSMGKKADALPDFSGLSLYEIATLLTREYNYQNHLPYNFDQKNYEFSETVEKGRVIRQEPVEGTPIKSVKNVKLWISKGLDIPEEHIFTNYIGKNLNDALESLGMKEVNTNVFFQETNKRQENFLVTNQNIEEGSNIDDFIKKGEIATLSANIWVEKNRNLITKNFIIDLPAKNLPYRFTLYKENPGEERKVYFSMLTKGGMSFSIPYSIKKFGKMTAMGNDVLLKEDITEEE